MVKPPNSASYMKQNIYEHILSKRKEFVIKKPVFWYRIFREINEEQYIREKNP